MSEPVIPERKIHRERLEAIRDWDHPKYSTGVHVMRNETVQMASRVLAAEAKVAELTRALKPTQSWVLQLIGERDTALGKISEQAATIERLTKELEMVRALSPYGSDMYKMADAALSKQVQPKEGQSNG